MIALRKTPGKICGGGIGLPKTNSPPALLKEPWQKAIPFCVGGGVSLMPAESSSTPRKTFAVAFQNLPGTAFGAAPQVVEAHIAELQAAEVGLRDLHVDLV